MDFVNKLTSGNSQGHHNEQSSSTDHKKESGGFLSSISDKLTHAAGGGRESEKNEDMLDKGTLSTVFCNLFIVIFNFTFFPEQSIHIFSTTCPFLFYHTSIHVVFFLFVSNC